MKLSVLLLFVVMNTCYLYSQTESHEGHNHEDNHDNSHHEHPKNEIGVANSPVYFVKEIIVPTSRER